MTQHHLSALLVSALCLATGCPLPSAPVPRVPGVPTGQFELWGEYRSMGKTSRLALSTIQDRFRLEQEGVVVIGSLSDADSIMVLVPDEETFFRSSKKRLAALARAGGASRSAHQRYRSALQSSRAAVVYEAVDRLFQSPCQSVDGHASCAHTQAGDLQTWVHTYDHVQPTGAGVIGTSKRKEFRMEHVYDTKRGLLLSARGDAGTGMQWSLTPDPAASPAALEASLFEVPASYREVLSDEDLNLTRKPVGSEDMLAGQTLRSGSVFVIDEPSPPARPEWSIVREQWRARGGAGVVKITSAFSVSDAELAEPPLRLGTDFVVERWDPETLAGDHSLQLKDGSLVFCAGGRLFKVHVHPDDLSEEHLVSLCRALAERHR